MSNQSLAEFYCRLKPAETGVALPLTRLERPRKRKGGSFLASLTAILVFLFVNMPDAHAEYGDVVINNYSDAAGMRPVVFPHWFHRVRFRCKVCHADLGFKFQAGGNEINMVKIIDGQFCGACHNGEIAWPVENCNLCHSAKPGTKTQVHESTIQKLERPAAAPTKK